MKILASGGACRFHIAMRYVICLLAASLMLLSATTARAATVAAVSDPVMGCFASLTGPIAAGDADKVSQLIAAHTKGQYNVDLAHGSRLCLNSEGGSLSEGVKLSKLLNEKGIGTAIGRGHVCLSACSLAFMGGTQFTESDIGDLPNRILHPLGRLGFHSPSLQVEAGSYDEATVTKAYDVALKSVGAVLEMAARNRFALSLSVQMLATPSSSMYDVTTVGEASRWGIGVGPVKESADLTTAGVAMACSNSDGQSLDEAVVARAVGDIQFDRTPDGIFAKAADGFRQEGATGCEVYYQPASARQPGLDSVGYVTITEIRPLYAYQLFPPEVRLSDLALADDRVPQTASAALSVTRTAGYSGICVVLSGTSIVDQNPCQANRSESRDASLQVYAKNIFVWPSGAKTVVETFQGPAQDKVKLNGAETRQDMIWHSDYASIQAALKPRMPWSQFEAYCWLNPSSGNRFCFVERPDPVGSAFGLSLFTD
jgi:hypothetical protein